MSPEQLRELEEVKQKLNAIMRGSDVEFIETLKRRLDIPGEAERTFGTLNLEDLNNVSTSSPSNGEVLKYNGSQWGPDVDL